MSCEYLREFSKKLETALIVYSGAWWKLIHEKNQKDLNSSRTVRTSRKVSNCKIASNMQQQCHYVSNIRTAAAAGTHNSNIVLVRGTAAETIGLSVTKTAEERPAIAGMPATVVTLT